MIASNPEFDTHRSQYNKLEMRMAETEASWAHELAQAATNVDGLKSELEDSKRAYEEAVSEVKGGLDGITECTDMLMLIARFVVVIEVSPV